MGICSENSNKRKKAEKEIPEEDLEKKQLELEKERLEKELENQKNEKEKLKQEIENEKLKQEKDKLEIKEKVKLEIKENESEKIKLVNRFEEIKKTINEYHKDVLNQENYIQNFKTFLNELNLDIIDINNKLNISVYNCINLPGNLPNINDKNNLFKELESISNKIYDFSGIIEDINNNKIKHIENIYTIIQQNIDEIEAVEKMKNKIDVSSIKNVYEINNNTIKDKLNELETIIEELKNKKNIYENNRKEIEKDIQNIQNKAKEINNKIENIHTSVLNSVRRTKVFDKKMNTKILKNSMLLDIKDFGNAANIFSSKLLFNDNNIDYEKEDLLRKDWKETCYVYDEYDLHDINYELKAVGLPENTFYNMCSIGFTLDRLIEILEFEIDGKKSNYKYKDYSLEFDIHLQNLESNKIHLKYKESKIKLTQGEKKVRKFYRNDYYGLSKNLKEQTAIFTLILKCDFEIISFEEEFFVKIKDGEYKWGGKVPLEGKTTLVKMSKKMGKFNFNKTQRIESLDKKPLKRTTLKIPVCFEGGNNIVKKISYLSHQTDKIELKEDKNEYEIKFIDIKQNYGEFIINGELENKCKGEWDCSLTDEQIEAEIPNDYKYNKEKFKEIAEDIIKNYDNEHKNDLIKVIDLVKIGKWVNKNIKYNISYHGKNDMSATEVYNKRVGVCHHFTKLYNALLYSLGYKCIYVSGYAVDKKDNFNEDDGHAWSLVKVDNKWLPFDATWGIFSGKLPVCHIFQSYFSRSVQTSSVDHIKIIKGKTYGNFINP